MKPHDSEILYPLALTQSWQKNRWSEAEKNFQRYTQLYSDNEAAWINYANLQSWAGKYADALHTLEIYRKRFGETQKYLTTKAKILALSKKLDSVKTINDGLLASNPENPMVS